MRRIRHRGAISCQFVSVYERKRAVRLVVSPPSEWVRLGDGNGRAALDGGGDQSGEEGMRAIRSRLELGVSLGGDEERVGGDLDHLDESVVGRNAGNDHAVLLELLAEVVIDFVAMAMALIDTGASVKLVGEGSVYDIAGPRAESHRGALVYDALLLG